MGGAAEVIAAILHGARDLRLETLPDPVPGPNEVLVRATYSALSTGTELGNYEGRSREVPDAPDYPRRTGYCHVGVVESVGNLVARYRSGDRLLSMAPHVSAFVASETSLLVPVPETVDAAQASLAYLAQLGVAALRQARYEAGEPVTVIGLGIIGLATVAMARVMGAQVTAVSNSRLRAAAALRMGARRVVLPEDPPECDSSPLIVLTANSWAAYRTAVEMANYGARVAVLGFPGRADAPPGFNPLDAAWLYGKQLTLIGAGYSPRIECAPAALRFNLRRNLEFVLQAMAMGAIDLRPLITHLLPASRMGEAYELASQREKSLIAAVFDWSAA
ncbi:MAG: zinc-binding alcohol dehydrogenase [Bryobacteraceae bacterium]|nr:zinc-binding alcohol dehydrogenase [Bryobacteraceae bacterium]